MKGETASHAGFHSASAAMTQTEDQMAKATIGASANLATAATAAAEANSHLVKQLEETSSELRELRALLHQERRDKRGPRSFNSSASNYWWTHGYKVGKMHTSLTCNTPKPGHKAEATRTDNMGGSQANKECCVGEANLNNKTTFEVCRNPPLLKQHETAISDSGCTDNFLEQSQIMNFLDGAPPQRCHHGVISHC
jgi:hypothetical protein